MNAVNQAFLQVLRAALLGQRAETELSPPEWQQLLNIAETHKVLGAQLMCEHATDMISQVAQAIANDMTAEQLLLAMRPHPTFEEVLSEALEDLVEKLNK